MMLFCVLLVAVIRTIAGVTDLERACEKLCLAVNAIPTVIDGCVTRLPEIGGKYKVKKMCSTSFTKLHTLE